MYKYVISNAMARSKFLSSMSRRSDTILEHICKIILYRDYRIPYVNGWVKTVSRSLDYVSSFNVKSSVSEDQYIETLFGSFPIDTSDARGILGNYALDFEKEGYPELEEQVFYELSGTLSGVCNNIINSVIPVLISKDHDRGYEYYRILVLTAFKDAGLDITSYI